jgi:exodeoxyribonuclease VII small subunit
MIPPHPPPPPHLVKKMESAELPLEEAMKLFQDGIQLVQSCSKALEGAELKVKEILESQGSFQEVPLADK